MRSSRVIDEIIASILTSSRSSRLTPSGSPPPKNGIFSNRSFSDPIFWISRICSRKSCMSNLPLSMRTASSSAFSASTTSSKSLIRPTMSPIPRMRRAMPSGRNSSSLSSDSPMPTNLIGLPVTSLTDSAAPPRASPSSLVRMTPSRLSRSLNVLATLTASWPIIASTTRKMFAGVTRLVDVVELLHQRLVDREAAGGVEDDDVAAGFGGAPATAARRSSSGVLPSAM